jgi:hypothetical protein
MIWINSEKNIRFIFTKYIYVILSYKNYRMKNLRFLLFVVLGIFASTSPFAQPSQSNLTDYVATFKMAENEYCKQIIITLKDGKLFGSTDANPSDGVELIPTKEADKFTTTIQGNEADIIFSRKEGKISAIKLSAGGGQVVLTGEKEAAAAQSLDAYAATYKMAENQYVKEIKIVVKEGKVLMSSDASPSDMLELTMSKEADMFTASIQGNDAEISFTRVDGKVAKIKISVAGGQVVLTGDRM